MAEKLMLIGMLILQVMTIGAIVDITDDVKAVRKIVTYLKGKKSSLDDKSNDISMMQTNIYVETQDLLDLQKSIIEKLAKPKIHQKWSDRK